MPLEPENETQNEWKKEPEEGIEPQLEVDECEETRERRGNPVTAGILKEDTETPTEFAERHDQRRHVPGGAWLAQGQQALTDLQCCQRAPRSHSDLLSTQSRSSPPKVEQPRVDSRPQCRLWGELGLGLSEATGRPPSCEP
ncbi:hypothetical protein NDU88_006161 [Pleurodeles waltl]|uniref:Uncharacterized protein n=1 Tax=Pleurodeles waltl TaxID=8319 RepID=A0AAV7WWT0_PLEWA|nr:hypothetical protein NDU88_006161 [Pleurodeles waltl]